MHGCGWRCVSRRGEGGLGGTRLSVACADILCAVTFRLGASFFIPVVLNRSLVVLPRVSECGPSRAVLCLVYCEYNYLYLYNSVITCRQHINSSASAPPNATKIAVKKVSDVDICMFGPEL